MFMEKPAARTLAECDQMVDACDRVHARLSVAHNMRVCPVLDFVEQRVRDGIIGDLQEIRGRGKEDKRAGGEDTMVLGTHVFDLMRRFGGDPQWVSARVLVQGRELKRADVTMEGPEGMGPIAGDQIEAMFAFPKGVTGYFASKKSSEVAGKRFGVDLYGSKGVLAIRAAHVPEVWINRTVNWTGEPWERLSFPAGMRPTGQNDAYHCMIDDLLGAMEARREPVAGIRNARWTIEMLMGIYAAQRTGGRVTLPLKERRHALTA
jgi:predicted dehydrogenase